MKHITTLILGFKEMKIVIALAKYKPLFYCKDRACSLIKELIAFESIKMLLQQNLKINFSDLQKELDRLSTDFSTKNVDKYC